MRTIAILFIALFISGCYSWRRGFEVSEKNKQETFTEEIEINDKDFFYLRKVEYNEIINYNNGKDSSDAPYANETSLKAYKSTNVNSSKKERVVEEKYLYLENYSKVNATSGRIVYFKTAPYWDIGKDRSLFKNRLPPSKLHSYYSSKDSIELSTSIVMQLGYWIKDSSTNEYNLVMCNNSGKFQMLATGDDTKLTCTKITHPNVDKNIRISAGEPELILIDNIMNVQKDKGLIYYRNINSDGSAQRKIYLSYNDSISEVKSICIGHKPRKCLNFKSDKNKSYFRAKGFLRLESKKIAKERKGYHKTFLLVFPERHLYNKNGLILDNEKDFK
ncbi:MAG: hypothetical protein AB8B74_06470 [Crocinitomicaceae bacterium]